MALEALPVGVWVSDADGRFVSGNAAGKKIWGGEKPYTGNPLEPCGAWTADGAALPAAECAMSRALRRGQPSPNSVVHIRTWDGRRKSILTGGVPLRDGTGAVVGAAAFDIDVTHLDAAKEQLTRLLQEKEILLKEIHHRVKNNFQVISSLLNMQRHHIKDAPTADLFQQSQARVRSMALVHQKLHQSMDLLKIEFSDYLRTLAGDLFRSYNLGGAVNLKVEAEKAVLPMESALPLGLVVNELVTNALKHAFPHGRAGEVKVSFAPSKTGGYRLAVNDSGVGAPKNFNPQKSSTLGLQIVNALAQQLESRLEFSRRGGTTFALDLRA